MTWRIEIPRWHPTDLNRLMNCHRMKRDRLKKADAKMLCDYARLHQVPRAKDVNARRRVTITYVVERGSGKRFRDDDNIWKSLLDGMKKAGMVKDDSPYWLVKEPVQYGRADQHGMIIELEDVA